MANKSMVILFVCHNRETVINVLQKVNDAKVNDAKVNDAKVNDAIIIFVGDQIIDDDIRSIPNIIIARELENNIEHEKKLLTFTAWYLVIKNQLFLDYKYICILENDVILSMNFINDLYNETIKNEFDIVSFKYGVDCFDKDISLDVFSDFLRIKQITTSMNWHNIGWYPSTNQCMKREHLQNFVDWYYPFCYYVKVKDEKKFSWYHERLFNVFLYHNKLTVKTIEGLKHLSCKSHEQTINKKIIIDPFPKKKWLLL